MLCKEHEVIIMIIIIIIITYVPRPRGRTYIDALYQKVDINDLKGTLVLEFDCII